MGLGKYNLNVATLTLALATLVFFSGTAEAQSQSKQDSSIFCLAAQDQELCEILVAGAKTAMLATAQAIKLSIEIAKKLEPYVDRIIDGLSMPPDSKNKVVNACHSDYQKVIDNFLAALNDLNKGNKSGTNAKLSTPTLTNCVAKLDRFRVTAPVVKKAKQDLDNYMQTCASVAKNV